MASDKVVLVGLDGSKQADNALSWAIDEAKRRGWAVQVVCAYTVPSFATTALDVTYAPADDEALRSGAEGVLEAAAARVKEAGLPVTTSVEVGDAAGVLVEKSADVDLVVVGSRGKGGFAGRLLGTVSSALPAHSKAPVVVVHYLTDAQRAKIAKRAADRPDDSGRVVVGVDGLGRDNPALLVAAAEAEARGSGLTIVGVVPVMVAGPEWLPAAVDVERIHQDYEKGLKDCANLVLERFPGLDIKWRLVDGSPSQALVESSETAELVVVGSRGFGGFKGLLLGSTSQAVLQYSKGAVMVVRVGPKSLEQARAQHAEIDGPADE